MEPVKFKKHDWVEYTGPSGDSLTSGFLYLVLDSTYDRGGGTIDINDNLGRRRVCVAEFFKFVAKDPLTLKLTSMLPTDPQARKGIPLCTGFLDYFDSAIVEVAKVSKAGNDQHNPGQPLHHARGKSMDHEDAFMRHYVQRGTFDEKMGVDHLAQAAWRILAMLQEQCEKRGAPLARGARLP